MTTKIAIACQGGESHTAFTAGVLKRILKEKKTKYEIIGLSGTSGGAICAFLAWYGLLKNDRNISIEKLDAFWKNNSASSFWELIFNEWIIQAIRIKDRISIPELSPYDFPEFAREMLKNLLEKHVVLSGEFKIFKNEENNIDTILASAAVPTLFRAEKTNGKFYWDGMFSQNPPLGQFILAIFN